MKDQIQETNRVAIVPITPVNGDTPIGGSSDARIARARAKIVEILKEENLMIVVETLDISTGRIIPMVELKAKEPQNAT